MSDHVEQFALVDAVPAGTDLVAAAYRALESGGLVPAGQGLDEVPIGGSGMTGAVTDAGPAALVVGGRTVGPVWITPERQQFVNLEGDMHTRCPRCGQVLGAAAGDEDPGEMSGQLSDALEAWDESGLEPVQTCVQCGFTGPWGDWDVAMSGVIGQIGLCVVDEDEGELDSAEVDAVLKALREGTGRRWAYVHYWG